MSTDISQLSNENISEDNSQIVDEILREMNGGDNEEPQVEMPIDQRVIDQTNNREIINDNQLNRQMDSNVNMVINDNLIPEVLREPEQNISINIKSEENIFESLTRKLQEPLIFALVSFIIFSPIIQKNLSRVIPRLFDSSNVIYQWLSVLFKSLFGSLLFLGIKNII